MPTEIYIEALLVDEEVADQVWQQWADRYITDDLAMLAWLQIREFDCVVQDSIAVRCFRNS